MNPAATRARVLRTANLVAAGFSPPPVIAAQESGHPRAALKTS